jgi:ferric-chelate reductase
MLTLTKMMGFSVQTYVWPSFVIWGFDRLIRLLRVLIFTLSSPPTDQQPNPESYHQDTRSADIATPELELVSPDVIRLIVPRPRHFHWSPGQNIFLTIPKLTRLFPEAHPFTIATVECKLGDPESNSMEDESVEKSTDVNSNSNLVFFINVRSGFTKRLADQISVDAKNMNMKVFVDGPYGSPPDLRVFDTCVLLAGEYIFPRGLDHSHGIISRRYWCFVYASIVP